MNQQAASSLIRQIQQGDKDSFRKLVESHQQYAYSIAFKLVCNDYEAEEIVQEAFIRIWKHINEFNTEMRFSTWMYKIVVNLCYDKMKAVKSRGILQFDFENSLILNQASTDNPEADLINREMAELIRFLTHELTPRQKLVFTLSEIEGLTSDEINKITGLSANKIKSNLYCARQAIKSKLDQIEERKVLYVR